LKNKSFYVKKINEDDILEILLEYLQETEFKDTVSSRGMILGTPGSDLRFISIFGNEFNLKKYNLEEIDSNQDFNVDHSFLENNPQFHL